MFLLSDAAAFNQVIVLLQAVAMTPRRSLTTDLEYGVFRFKMLACAYALSCWGMACRPPALSETVRLPDFVVYRGFRRDRFRGWFVPDGVMCGPAAGELHRELLRVAL